MKIGLKGAALAAMSALVGLQLTISWFIMRALAELSQRELRVAGDMAGREITEPVLPSSIFNLKSS